MIVESMVHTIFLLAVSLVPSLGSDASEIENARKLLARAGYPGGKDFPTIEILYNTREAHRKIAQSIANTWKEKLGINAELRNIEWKVYLDRLINVHVSPEGMPVERREARARLGFRVCVEATSRPHGGVIPWNPPVPGPFRGGIPGWKGGYFTGSHQGHE